MALSLGVLSIATSLSLIIVPSAALAQGNCACLLSSPPSGALGSISVANGDVFKTGAAGLESAGAGTTINVGDVVSTGGTSSATLSLGGGCDLALGASAQLTITPVGNNLCVRIQQESVGEVEQDGAGTVIAGGLAAGVGLFVGLGLDDPASR
ncbi:hypothetical protein [Devosia sp.]|uniref:hypothetical protein n=1 Tax=Devosia sp. TaxID=1871048 RepID=UPI002635A99C|nr:hypothetical protein [Devosia sp.]